MDSIFKGRLPDGTFVIACGKRTSKRCSFCAAAGATLECDGCDKALCTTCAVSPREGLDFCPKCFDPAFRHYLKIQPHSIVTMGVVQRRAAFRAWARAAPETFLELTKPLTATAKAVLR